MRIFIAPAAPRAAEPGAGRRPAAALGLALMLALATACGGGTAAPADAAGDGTPATGPYRARLVHTLRLGASDNAETVKLLPGRAEALVVASKARKLTLVTVAATGLSVSREATLFGADASESELTNAAVAPDGTFAVLTRTLLVVDAGGAQTDCGGELVFVDTTDSAAFGTILKQVAVGPMPDSVAISDDGRVVVSGDERDGPDAWGKCEVAGETASLTILDLPAGPASATVRRRIVMVDAASGPREPEGVAIGRDNDLVFVTLQDSHEVAHFRLSALPADPEPTSAVLAIGALPPNALGAGPWPDGIARFVGPDDRDQFVTAGEWNDTFAILDAAGTVLSNTEIAAADIPDHFPRVVAAGSPLFSPDSVASFVHGGHTYAAFTLRHAGAVAVYDVSDPAVPVFTQVIAVGAAETGQADENGSSVRPEGISASADGQFVVVANEAESSVSLLVVE